VIRGKHVIAEPTGTSTLFRVRVDDVPVCAITKTKDPNFTHWHCGLCLHFTRDLDPMLYHVFDWHYDEASEAFIEVLLTNMAQLFGLPHEPYQERGQVVGRPPEKVWYTGEVRTNERRARMPWRLRDSEYR